MKNWRNLFLICALPLIAACSTALPEDIQPVGNFQLERYLGRWYEIARLDHSFERGLSRVTATYSRRDDGGVRVLNRGFDDANGKWKEAEGKAYFVGDAATGHLKVSFFGPFYGTYGIFALDPDYRYALISGPDKSYFWLLARTPALDETELKRLVAVAASKGFDTSALIFPAHD